MSIHKYVTPKGEQRYRVMWRDLDRVQRSRSFRALADAKRFNAEITLGEVKVRHADHKSTIASWLEEWFASYSQEWSITTVKQRASICDKWIVPLIGHKPLKSISPLSIREFRNEMARQGATNNTINSTISVLSAALTAAAENDLIVGNPCRDLRRLPHFRPSADALSPLEVEEFRHWMPTARDRLMVSILAYAGLRPAELVALEWRHITDTLIIVERSAQAGRIVPTKTRNRRAVPICQMLLADIDEHGRGEPDELVCPGERGGILNWKNWFRRVWQPASQHVGLKYRPYDLRHTYASMQIHAGANVMEVAQWLGHANPTMTLNVYAHFFSEARMERHVSVDSAIRAARSASASSRRPFAEPAAASARASA